MRTVVTMAAHASKSQVARGGNLQTGRNSWIRAIGLHTSVCTAHLPPPPLLSSNEGAAESNWHSECNEVELEKGSAPFRTETPFN